MDTKKCTNCSRAPQLLANFINPQGKECSTCDKCREKGMKGDHRLTRREYHNELQKEKKYYKVYRAKQIEENPDEFRQHNNEVGREWRSKNVERARIWSRTNTNTRLDALKRSAVKRKIEWNLTDEDAKKMLTEPCVYCGHIDLEVRVNGIDRLDSSKSYTTDNCRPCCKDCNYMKGTYDPTTFIERARRIVACSAEFPDIVQCTEHKKINRL